MSDDITCTYDWKTFRRWMSRAHPEISVPDEGCMRELDALFAAHDGLRDELIEAVRKAPGNRAMAIYRARRDGWWPADEAVADIRDAPGNRATVIWLARHDGWWPENLD